MKQQEAKYCDAKWSFSITTMVDFGTKILGTQNANLKHQRF
jgi:hypothetical protein